MSSDETRTPSSTGPSTGSSSKQSGDQSHSSSQSQASTFDTQPPSSQEPSDTISQAWGQLAVIGSSTCYGNNHFSSYCSTVTFFLSNLMYFFITI